MGSEWNASWWSRARRAEQGSTTVIAALLIAAIVVLTLVALLATSHLVKHRRAGVAAELSAVAGAIALQRGSPACSAAARIAEDNRAELETCVEEGEDVQVAVVKQEKTATARAGPAEG